ncbi:MAG: EscU/YscU/HrcU family type III secretion system export apparatus switch protein, partial [Pseudomonadota bacterium]
MSEDSQSSQEKSHEATPQKLEKARRKGDLARSQDMQTFMAYIGLSVAVFIGGGWAAANLGETLSAFLARPAELSSMILAQSSDVFGLLAGRIGA